MERKGTSSIMRNLEREHAYYQAFDKLLAAGFSVQEAEGHVKDLMNGYDPREAHAEELRKQKAARRWGLLLPALQLLGGRAL